ncbi:hypothetical protein L6452_35408 [Arctium lappa]|uniref:Uncharacterized protein n=1 Tax=Arctium lappa TaxID=4217 RepID=A0ACB8Y720_ARCLA|nr:hypothetical protein L6452_35408 [Arctium lappa]
MHELLLISSGLTLTILNIQPVLHDSCNLLDKLGMVHALFFTILARFMPIACFFFFFSHFLLASFKPFLSPQQRSLQQNREELCFISRIKPHTQFTVAVAVAVAVGSSGDSRRHHRQFSICYNRHTRNLCSRNCVVHSSSLLICELVSVQRSL